ncbi:hypothetical protein ABID22_000958 [Pontibacter aydingkolensis]|uniref:Lipoprotein n=1 Tax=Pontibacter aydingkolensis TaxID=1911536 RepID=A0ABS7CSJ6_9BACT|nr:hypothetical protein [Pontibacter aydingkolensis]MBW7466790.1 hypothetical protein [Pontibacter aydingkolensis]
MKFTLKTCLALLFGSVLFTSCENCKSPSITTFTETDTDWLAYTADAPTDGKPDTIWFTNDAGADIKFTRTQLYANNLPGDGFTFDDKCIDQMNAQAGAIIQDVTRKMPGLATYILKKPNDLQVKLLVEKLGTYEIQEENPTHASLTIDGLTYVDVFEVSIPGNDTDDKGKVKLVYFNKTHGFIRVEFYGGKFLQLQA